MRKPLPFEEAQIQAALVRHRYYIKGDPRGARADLSFRNISGIDLHGHILTNIILKGACLSGVNLSKSDLTGADFFGADLEGADLHDSTLTGADFRGANLSRTILTSCRLQGADFSAGGPSGTSNARLTEAKLGHALLCQANLNGCDLSGAELVDADLSGADLSTAIMVGAELSGARLHDVKLNKTVLELSRLSQSQLDHLGSTAGIAEPTYEVASAPMVTAAIREHAQWIESGGTRGRRLDLEGMRLTDAPMREKNLAGARLRRCALNGLDLTGTILDMADISYSQFRGTRLDSASLKGVNCRGVDFSHAHMSGARFELMRLPGNKGWPTNFDGALLCHADLTNATFCGALLNYADLRGSIISGTNFIDVDLSKTKMSPEAEPNVTACRRAVVRYHEPKIFVKLPSGIFTTVNWSISGICLSYSDKPLVPETIVRAKIVAEGRQPPRDACFTVVRYDEDRGFLLLKFADMQDALIDYLQSLVATP